MNLEEKPFSDKLRQKFEQGGKRQGLHGHTGRAITKIRKKKSWEPYISFIRRKGQQIMDACSWVYESGYPYYDDFGSRRRRNVRAQITSALEDSL